MIVLYGVFTILHGLVHLFYAGQSARVFELQSGMTWPDRSWLLDGILTEQTGRSIATAGLVASAVIFAAAGLGLFVRGAWWRPVMITAAALSSAVFVLFWDGAVAKLHDKGAVGVAINVAMVVLAVGFGLPSVR